MGISQHTSTTEASPSPAAAATSSRDREIRSLLIGRSPGHEILGAVTEAALATPGVLGVHELRAEYLGPDVVHLGLHLAVRRGTPVEEADQIAAAARDAIHGVVAGAYCVIHIDPAEQRSLASHQASTSAATRPNL